MGKPHRGERGRASSSLLTLSNKDELNVGPSLGNSRSGLKGGVSCLWALVSYTVGKIVVPTVIELVQRLNKTTNTVLVQTE